MTRYFVIPETPSTPRRFAIVERGAVVQVLASRPDGEEIPRPLGVAWRLKPVDYTDVRPLTYLFTNGRPIRR